MHQSIEQWQQIRSYMVVADISQTLIVVHKGYAYCGIHKT